MELKKFCPPTVFTALTLVCCFAIEAKSADGGQLAPVDSPYLQELSKKCSSQALGQSQDITKNLIDMSSLKEELKTKEERERARQVLKDGYSISEKSVKCIENYILAKVGPDTPFDKVASGQLAKPVFDQIDKTIKVIDSRLEKLPSPDEKCGAKAKPKQPADQNLAFEMDYDIKNPCVQSLMLMSQDLEKFKGTLNMISHLTLVKFDAKATFKDAIDSLAAQRKAQIEWAEMQTREPDDHPVTQGKATAR